MIRLVLKCLADDSTGECAHQAQVGGSTERVNAGDGRMRRMEEDIAQIDERTQLWKKTLDVQDCSDRREDTAVEEEIGRARQCRKQRMGQLDEDIPQIN